MKQYCAKGGYESNTFVQHTLTFSYDMLVEMVEHLKACLEIALSRTGNWQRFCIHHDDTLPFLLQVSCLLDEGKIFLNFTTTKIYVYPTIHIKILMKHWRQTWEIKNYNLLFPYINGFIFYTCQHRVFSSRSVQ